MPNQQRKQPNQPTTERVRLTANNPRGYSSGKGNRIEAHEGVRETEDELKIMTNRLRKEGCGGVCCVKG
jgi:hypothetical protein